MAEEVVIEEALRAGDVVCNGGSGGTRDGFGAYGIIGIVAVDVIPCSIRPIHPHAVLAFAVVGLVLPPVCERAAVPFH